jgi:hypothetical protein
MDASTTSKNAVFVIGKSWRYLPFVSIDIMAHEYAHGIDDYTLGLGAMTTSNPEIHALAERLNLTAFH